MGELRLLLLEDDSIDAELNKYELRKAGLKFISRQVDTEHAFKQALREFAPDIVLADYALPSYSGSAALKYLQEANPDLPVIMVTGAIGEERAAELLREGARDYILKDRLVRLPTAILRVLDEQKAIKSKRESEKRLREAERKFRILFETSNDGIFLEDANGFVDCNEKAAGMYGLEKQDIKGHTFADFGPERQPDGRLSSNVEAEKYRAAMLGETQCFEWRAQHADKSSFDVEISLNRIELDERGYLQAIVHDITERNRREDVLRASESRFRMIFENVPMCIREIDLSGRITSSNKAGFDMMEGGEGGELFNHLYLDIVEKSDCEHVEQLFARACAGETIYFEFKSSGKPSKIFKSCFVPIKRADSSVEKLMEIMEDITERKRAEELIRNFAFSDSLTQLPNRRLLSDRLIQAMLLSKRSGHYCALMFLDLDNFKPLNDEHGHDVGDLLLVEVARRINICVREADTVARFGGDEFVVMLSDLGNDRAESFAQATAVAEKIRSVLSEPYELKFIREGIENTIVHHCTSSIGVELFINHEASQEEIIRCADSAMYQAKQEGGDTIRFFVQPEVEPLAKKRTRV